MMEMAEKSSVSFSGCGFLGVYHIGVAACLRKYAPQVLENKITGASAGALAAAAVICDGSLGLMMSNFLHFGQEAHKRTLGAFCPTFDMDQLLKEAIYEIMPADAHIRCSGRLVISVTRVSDGKNIQLRHFETQEDLVNALMSSSFIPGFSGLLPYSVGGVRYIDGGFTDNQPMVDDHTITVSPFAGEGDICPKDNTPGVMMVSMGGTMIECSTRNLYRSTCVVFPPGPNTLSKMCQQGFDDALEFLQRQDLIACRECLAMETSISKGMSISQRSRSIHRQRSMRRERPVALGSCSYLDGNYCDTCTREKQNVVFDKLPKNIGKVVQEAKAKRQDDFVLQLLRYRFIRIIFLLVLPISLPMNLAYMILFKFNRFTPTYEGVIEFTLAIKTHLITILESFSLFSNHEPSHRQYHRLSSRRIKNRDATPIPRIEKHVNYHDTDVRTRSGKSEAGSLTDQHQQYTSQNMAPRTSLKPTSWRPSEDSFTEQSRITEENKSFDSDSEDNVSDPVVTSLPEAGIQKTLLGEGSTQEAVIAYYFTDQDTDEVFNAESLSGALCSSGGGEIG